MEMKSFRIFLLTTLFLFLFVVSTRSSFADGENPGDYLHSRTYIGVVATSVSVGDGGAFSGTNYSRVNNSYEVDLLPALAQNFGFGILAGHREEAYALEVSFWQSNHTATFGPGTILAAPGSGFSNSNLSTAAYETAVYSSINLDFKRYFLTEMRLQPFINLGVSFPWIVVPNSAASFVLNQQTQQYQLEMGSVTLAGLGLNLGVGAEFYLSPNISLVGGAYERWASFNQFKGYAAQFNQLAETSNSSSNDGSGFVFELGTTFGFQ